MWGGGWLRSRRALPRRRREQAAGSAWLRPAGSTRVSAADKILMLLQGSVLFTDVRVSGKHLKLFPALQGG